MIILKLQLNITKSYYNVGKRCIKIEKQFCAKEF